MKTLFQKQTATVLLFIGLVALNLACNKNEEIGYNVHPEGNLINVFFENNIPILAHTVKEDSIRTDEVLTNLIGSIVDPIFGTTTAGMYSHYRLTTTDVNFGNNPVCDSIVLSLAYKGIYGDTNFFHTLQVYEIAEDFSQEKSYYSNNRLGVYKYDLANYSFSPNLKDSVILGTTRFAPHLRVKLKKSLGQKIISASGTSNLSNNSNFLKFFKGLYITVKKANNQGSIIYFNPTSSLSKLILYYHNDTDTAKVYNFVVNDNCARFNTFEHYNYTGANSLFIQQINGDTSLGNNLLYLQAMSGTKIRLKVPQFVNLNLLGKIAINKAELVLKIDETDLTTYKQPDALAMAMIKEDGTLSFLPDYTLYGDAYFGGKYNTVTKEYRFNMGKYLQNALENNTFNDKGLFITIAGASTGARRAVVLGPQNALGKMKLEVIYSIIK